MTRKFAELPLSSSTLKGLSSAHFVGCTPIQDIVIPQALEGHDLWATSPTGSGKTLSYLIPLLETLNKEKWSHTDGLGALVLLPTRELAVQVFDVLKLIGKYYNLSAGLLIGGKNYALEAKSLGSMNILIATPGRLLHHLDKTPNFSTHNLKVLVVDEFDLLLEMGFVKSTIAINSALPTEKQTMLFSATSSSQVSSLVTQIVNANNCILVNCLSSGESSVQKLVALKDIEKVPVSASLPAALKHHVTFCDLQSKFTVLYQFLRKHANSKVLVFFGTCKEVRFGYESFCKLRPGTPIMEIHGKQKQLSRTKTYYKFCDLKTGALFTTDVCSRGLDFPHIDYVVHFDCPDSFEIYVHRVGRTARYKAEGSSILFLCEFERSFLDGLNANNIEWATMKLHSNNSLTSQLEKICSKHPEIKHLAEKAFISYLRSIFILHGKNQSLLSDINMTEYASSLGLANVPYIKGSRQ